jgi:large subunit ribosomal protein L4
MLSVPVYDQNGAKIGEESIDPAAFGVKGINKQLLHDVVVMHEANKRVGTVNTRGRADVAGSGKKMYRQKGTGNARMGAKRTNKRVGGGMAFARRNRDYSYSLPKRAVRLAIRMALLSKFQDGQALIVDGLGASTPDAKPKTGPIAKLLRTIRRPDLAEADAAPADKESKAKASRRTLADRSVLIGTPALDPFIYRGARNIEGVIVAPIAEFNTRDVLRQRYLLLTREAFVALKERVAQPVTRKKAAAPAPAQTEA